MKIIAKQNKQPKPLRSTKTKKNADLLDIKISFLE